MLSPWRRVEKLLAGLTGVSDGGPPGEAVALAGVCGAGAVVLAEVLLDLVARDLHRRQRVAHARLGVHVLRRRGGRDHLGVAAVGARETVFKHASNLCTSESRDIQGIAVSWLDQIHKLCLKMLLHRP